MAEPIIYDLAQVARFSMLELLLHCQFFIGAIGRPTSISIFVATFVARRRFANPLDTKSNFNIGKAYSDQNGITQDHFFVIFVCRLGPIKQPRH